MKANKYIKKNEEIRIFSRQYLYNILLEQNSEYLDKYKAEILNDCLRISLDYVSILDRMIKAHNESDYININNFHKEIVFHLEKYGSTTEKLINSIEIIYERQKEDIYNYYVKMIQSLYSNYQSHIIKNILSNRLLVNNDKFNKQEVKNKVFLSHAYDDRIIAFALFIEFYKKNIYLYVDWMHNGIIDNGAFLKHILMSQLETSKQLILLRSPNVEMNKNGNLRQWCAWEVGCFKGLHNNNNNFLIDTIDYEDTKTNRMYDDFNRIIGFSNGLLYGKNI